MYRRQLWGCGTPNVASGSLHTLEVEKASGTSRNKKPACKRQPVQAAADVDENRLHTREVSGLDVWSGVRSMAPRQGSTLSEIPDTGSRQIRMLGAAYMHFLACFFCAGPVRRPASG